MKPATAAETVRAIIDASSAILLYKAGLLERYCQMVQLLMTRSVFAEATVPRQSGADAIFRLSMRQPGIVVLDDPLNPDCLESVADVDRLDRGERDTLLHYLNGAARFVVIDDGKAVRVCRRQGIPHVNALLVPKMLYFTQRLPLDQIDHYFVRLCSIGRYSKHVVDWAKRCGAGQLEFFIDERKP
jgi:hypothetical protein